MTDTPIKVAAVGAGYFSKFHYEAWNRLGVNLVGICSLTLKSAKTIAKDFGAQQTFTDLEKMLDYTQPDLLDIISPPKPISILSLPPLTVAFP